MFDEAEGVTLLFARLCFIACKTNKYCMKRYCTNGMWQIVLFIHIYSNLGVSLTSLNLQFHPISLRWFKIGPKANSHPRVTIAMFNAVPTKIASKWNFIWRQFKIRNLPRSETIMKQMTFGSQNLISELHDVEQRTNSTKIVALKRSRFCNKNSLHSPRCIQWSSMQ